jgi:ATP-dependent exoDNAse (exonuclease V) alpha subunit
MKAFRHMYPISLAFARTVHSVQGQTCEKLVYVMGKKVFNKELL